MLVFLGGYAGPEHLWYGICLASNATLLIIYAKQQGVKPGVRAGQYLVATLGVLGTVYGLVAVLR